MLKQIILPFTIIFSTIVYAEDPGPKELFDEANCVKCHSTDRLKAREEKVNNFEKLHKSVNNCAINTGAGWFDEEIEDVSKYLNKHYYHFDEKK